MDDGHRFDPEDEEFYGTHGSIGIPKFDRLLGGGIPRGFTILAIGDAGAGMDLFSKQFSSPVEDPEKTIYISTNEKEDEILQVFQKYGWPSDLGLRPIGHEYNMEILQRDLAASRLRLEGFSVPDIQRLARTRFVESGTKDWLIDMTTSITNLKDYFRVAIDSLDFFFQRYEPSRVLSMVRLMQTHVQKSRGLLLMNLSSGIVDVSTERSLSALADVVFEFDVVRMGSEFETRLTIRRFRNSPENMAVISFRVTGEEGITPETVERIS